MAGLVTGSTGGSCRVPWRASDGSLDVQIPVDVLDPLVLFWIHRRKPDPCEIYAESRISLLVPVSHKQDGDVVVLDNEIGRSLVATVTRRVRLPLNHVNDCDVILALIGRHILGFQVETFERDVDA